MPSLCQILDQMHYQLSMQIHRLFCYYYTIGLNNKLLDLLSNLCKVQVILSLIEMMYATISWDPD